MAEAEEWEWLPSPSHLFQDSPRYRYEDDDQDDYGGLFGRDEGGDQPSTSAYLHSNKGQLSENLSSTASSPILKHSLTAMVMAKERLSALDALHHSVSEWIEPQLVFTKLHGHHCEGFEVYKVIAYLRNFPKAKEALISLLSDPVVCDAVMSNKAFQELAYECAGFVLFSWFIHVVCCVQLMILKFMLPDGADDRLEGWDSTSACSSSLGRKAYKLLKEKLTEAVDILFSLLGSHTFEKNVVDHLDATAKSCILLVAVLIFLVVSKRSEGLYLGQTL